MSNYETFNLHFHCHRNHDADAGGTECPATFEREFRIIAQRGDVYNSGTKKHYYYLLSAISCDLQISERLDLVDKAINMRENIIGINDIEYPFCIFIKEIFLKASQAPADERIKLLENAFVVCSNGAYIYNSVEMFESAQHLNSSFLI